MFVGIPDDFQLLSNVPLEELTVGKLEGSLTVAMFPNRPGSPIVGKVNRSASATDSIRCYKTCMPHPGERCPSSSDAQSLHHSDSDKQPEDPRHLLEPGRSPPLTTSVSTVRRHLHWSLRGAPTLVTP